MRHSFRWLIKATRHMDRTPTHYRATRSSTIAFIVRAAASFPVVLAMVGPVLAADPNSVKGLVADNCSRCHFVPPYNKSGLKTLNAPPFKDMANNPDVYTETRLRTFLQKPHYPMEPIILSARDIDNLIAFIRSMRDQ